MFTIVYYTTLYILIGFAVFILLDRYDERDEKINVNDDADFIAVFVALWPLFAPIAFFGITANNKKSPFAFLARAVNKINGRK